MPPISRLLGGSLLTLLLVFPGASVSAQELTPEKLAPIKAAAVFIKVTIGPAGNTGSGFVVRSDKDGTVYVVTNQHVIRLALLGDSKNPLVGPDGAPIVLPEGLPQPKIEAIFESGTPNERTGKVEIVAADEQYDLAILRVKGVANPPRPIDLSRPPTLVETTPVIVCGFPFGDQLATGGRNPAVSIGKGTISSIRLDEAGAAEKVQIDGALNPGNSGGPVLTMDGRLVGVAVSAIRGATLGFAVPFRRLNEMMRGRIGLVRIRMGAGPEQPLLIEADLLDPFGGINRKAIRVHLLKSEPDAPCPVKPVNGKWPLLPKAERRVLQVQGTKAIDLVPSPPDVTAVWTQIEYERSDGTLVRGEPMRQTRPRIRSLAGGPEPYVPIRNARYRVVPQRPRASNFEAVVPSPPDTVPPLPLGSPTLLDLVRFTEKFADKKPVTVHAAVGLSHIQRRGRMSTFSQVNNENGASIDGLDLYMSRAIAADLSPYLSQTINYPARLVVAQLDAADPRLPKVRNGAAYEVQEIGFFDDTNTVVRTFRSEGEIVRESPTLADVNRNPELYAGKTVVLEGRANVTGNQNILQMFSLRHTPVSNLEFRLSPDLTAQYRASGPAAPKHIIATCILGVSENGISPWPLAVTKVEFVDKEGETIKTLTGEAPILPTDAGPQSSPNGVGPPRQFQGTNRNPSSGVARINPPTATPEAASSTPPSSATESTVEMGWLKWVSLGFIAAGIGALVAGGIMMTSGNGGGLDDDEDDDDNKPTRKKRRR